MNNNIVGDLSSTFNTNNSPQFFGKNIANQNDEKSSSLNPPDQQQSGTTHQ